MNPSISAILDELCKEIRVIPSSKNYWFIRTKSGSLYDTFKESNFVGIEHEQISIRDYREIRNAYETGTAFAAAVKNKLDAYYNADENRVHPGAQQIGLTAGQIDKFYNRIKKGDSVIIPSENSNHLSFGEITESHIAEFTQTEKSKILFSGVLNKRVNWIKEIEKSKIDPFLYKMLANHQAVAEVDKYADIIERSLGDLYMLGDDAHFIINVEKEARIPAKDLFGLGNKLLELVDDFCIEYNIADAKSDQLDMSINLNSPGKIDLKSKFKKTTVLTCLILFFNGGGYDFKNGDSIRFGGIDHLINAISDFLDRKQERVTRAEIFKTYKDSLRIESTKELIDLIKQSSSNKDLPK